MNKILQIYKTLLSSYGPQGWWPLLELNNKKNIKITKSGSVRGYHPGDYSYPRTDAQRFEICVGAILTQNTAWPNVEKALVNLKKIGCLYPQKIRKGNDRKLLAAIRPSGYYYQKLKKLRIFTQFYVSLKTRTPSREELLALWGIGEETADSMLLYAFKVPTFVVDAYTKRIFCNLGLVKEGCKYNEVKELFERNLKKDIKVYQEYHALLVEHAKRHYMKKDIYGHCPIKIALQKGQI